MGTRTAVRVGACLALAITATAISVMAGIGAPVTGASATTSAITASAPCGSMVNRPSAIRKVMIIVMENTTFGSVIGSSSAPHINALANACGLATNYHGIQFPSLPNYIELTSGTAPAAIAGNGSKGVDCQPSATCQSTNASIFTQLQTAGLTWKGYAESMPHNCGLANAGNYAPRHNPAVYYVNNRKTCASDDVPMGTTSSGALASDLSAGKLPSYSFVTPNLCNDGHNTCGGVAPVVEQDRTVAAWLPKIVASPDYQSGDLVVILTADTSADSDETNHLATIVMSPYVPAHTISSKALTHYSLLRLSEELTGLHTYLGKAASAPDMPAAFGISPT